jgi:hypothetical protein
LEYNADTPTSLVEAAVIQWRWVEDCFPQRDQWNSIHEKLVAKWKDLRAYVAEPVYFAHDGVEEDVLTIAYLRDTAREAGLRNTSIRMKDLGWDAERECFVDVDEFSIETLFKLYPWETLLREPFGPHALLSISQGQKPQSGPHAVDRADLEDALVEQSPARRTLGIVSGPRATLTLLSGWPASIATICTQTLAWQRGRECEHRGRFTELRHPRSVC